MVFLRRRRKLPLRAEDLMTRDPVTIKEDASIAEAAKIMWKKRIGSLLVVDENGKLKGIVTERDLVFACSEEWDVREHKVYEIMTENPIAAKSDDDVIEVINKMREANVRHLPIVDEEGRPVGVISYRDVLDFIMTFFSITLGIKEE